MKKIKTTPKMIKTTEQSLINQFAESKGEPIRMFMDCNMHRLTISCNPMYDISQLTTEEIQKVPLRNFMPITVTDRDVQYLFTNKFIFCDFIANYEYCNELVTESLLPFFNENIKGHDMSEIEEFAVKLGQWFIDKDGEDKRGKLMSTKPDVNDQRALYEWEKQYNELWDSYHQFEKRSVWRASKFIRDYCTFKDMYCRYFTRNFFPNYQGIIDKMLVEK